MMTLIIWGTPFVVALAFFAWASIANARRKAADARAEVASAAQQRAERQIINQHKAAIERKAAVESARAETLKTEQRHEATNYPRHDLDDVFVLHPINDSDSFGGHAASGHASESSASTDNNE